MTQYLLLITDNADLAAAVRGLLAGNADLAACTLAQVAADDPLPSGPRPALTLLGLDATGRANLVRTQWPGGWVVLAATASQAEQAAALSAERGLLTGIIDGEKGGSLVGTLRALLARWQPADPIDDAASNPWLRAILDSIPYGMFIKDAEGHYRIINQESAALLNSTPEEIEGRLDRDFVQTHRIEDVRAYDRMILENDQALSYTFTDTINGESRMFHVDKGPLRSPGGDLAGIIGVSRDVTERFRAEYALRESETRFKHLAENAPDMIFRWSYAAGFEYVSPASLDVIGYTPEDHYADPGLSYRSIHPDDIPVYESVFSDLADPEGPRRYCVIRWRHKAGQTVYVEMRMAPIFDEHDNLIAVDGIARDITQHVITRERLRDLTTRLTQAHEDERRRIAHELHDHIGQALTVAKLRAKMIEGGLEDDTARQKLGVLIDLLDEMLRDVRALSRELRPPLLEEMGWAPALELLCESFATRSGLSVGYQQAVEVVRLPHDRELAAYRVVQEALTNAARHAQAEHITVKTAMEGDRLAVSIADNGVGFDLDAATGEGAGLGLLGMQERVDNVGGMLHIDSSPGNGTRITAYLPREEGQHENDYHPVSRGSSPGAGGAAGAA